MRRLAFLLVYILLQQPGSALAAKREIVEGPVRVTVMRVIDGDTFVAEAHIWPGHRVRVAVRIRGIDAPEMRSRCERERRAAQDSRAALTMLLGSGQVFISNVGGGKYHGRVLADVETGDGRRVAAALLNNGHARPYGGGTRLSFCN